MRVSKKSGKKPTDRLKNGFSRVPDLVSLFAVVKVQTKSFLLQLDWHYY
jgi:hypothetical protein